MKKALAIVKWLLAAIFIIVLILCLIMDIEPKLFDQTANDYTQTDRTWMSQLDDNILLSQISVPGAHDAGTNNGYMPFFLKCQDSSTEELLNMGCRYLDIRVGEGEEDGQQVLNIYHGFLKCLADETPFEGTLGLSDVLEDCYNFLEQNPSETILFVVKYEHGDETIGNIQELLQHYTDENSDMWLLTDSMPTLGQARGKIVLFRRFADEAKLNNKAGIPLLWEDQGGNDDTTLDLARCNNEGQLLYVQDRFEYGNNDKWEAFERSCAKTGQCLDEGATVINFLSTKGTFAYGHPHDHAKMLNNMLKSSVPDQLLGSNSTQFGWVIMDFVDSTMSRKIYERNF